MFFRKKNKNTRQEDNGKRVALVQSQLIIENRTSDQDPGEVCTGELLGLKPGECFTSKDPKKIYKFLIESYRNNIRDVVLYIDSDVTEKLMDLIMSRAEANRAVKKMVQETRYLNSFSTSRETRKKIFDRIRKSDVKCDYGFSLGTTDSMLATLNRGQASDTVEQVVIVSDKRTPYTKEIYDNFDDKGTDTRKYRVSEVTAELLNSFSDLKKVVLAFTTDEDHEKWEDLVDDIKYNGELVFMELFETFLIEKKTLKPGRFEKVNCVSCSTCCRGKNIPELSNTTQYETSLQTLCKLGRANGFGSLLSSGAVYITPVDEA